MAMDWKGFFRPSIFKIYCTALLFLLALVGLAFVSVPMDGCNCPTFMHIAAYFVLIPIIALSMIWLYSFQYFSIPFFLVDLVFLYVISCLFAWVDTKIRKKIKIPSLAVFIAMLLLFGFAFTVAFPCECRGWWGDPRASAGELLADLVDAPGPLKTTSEVVFSPNYVLTAAGLAYKLPINPDQVCMSLGDFQADSRFQLVQGENPEIKWLGSANTKARIAVVCNVSLSAFEYNFKAYGLDQYNMDCNAACEGKDLCCLVILRKSQ